MMLWPLAIIITQICFCHGQDNNRGNQGYSAGFVNPTFFNPIGTPSNFGSARFGNPTTNYYLMDPFSPFGNQGVSTNQGSYPNQQQYPKQIGVPNPTQGNYANQGYNPNDLQRYPGQANNQGPVNYPIQGGSTNYRPSYNGPFSPPINYFNPNSNYPPLQNDIKPYPGNMNMPNPGRIPSNQGEYYGRPDFGLRLAPQYQYQDALQNIYFPGQSNYNPFNPNNNGNNFLDMNIHFPGPTSRPVNAGQNSISSGQMANPANSYYNNMNNPGQGSAPPTQVPNPLNNANPGPNVIPGMIYYIPPNQQLQLLNPQNYNNTMVAIVGKPAVVTQTNLSPGQFIFNDSTESPAQKQCVQDCQTTTEYNPLCGTNNVTYINPGKFECARNCGVNVYVRQTGACRSQ